MALWLYSRSKLHNLKNYDNTQDCIYPHECIILRLIIYIIKDYVMRIFVYMHEETSLEERSNERLVEWSNSKNQIYIKLFGYLIKLEYICIEFIEDIFSPHIFFAVSVVFLPKVAYIRRSKKTTFHLYKRLYINELDKIKTTSCFQNLKVRRTEGY